MEKIKRIGLIVYYTFLWPLFIFCLLLVIFGGIPAILEYKIGRIFIFIIIFTLPFILGYFLRHHFKILGKSIMNIPSFIKNIKLTLPAVILSGCIILGGFFYASIAMEQRATKERLNFELFNRCQGTISLASQENKEMIFNRKLKCQALLKDLEEKWEGIIGISYDDFDDFCMVQYEKNGQIEYLNLGDVPTNLTRKVNEVEDSVEIECGPEQREADICIETYQPVCATVNIQCITTPCDPIKETYANSCKACINPLVNSYAEGECGN